MIALRVEEEGWQWIDGEFGYELVRVDVHEDGRFTNRKVTLTRVPAISANEIDLRARPKDLTKGKVPNVPTYVMQAYDVCREGFRPDVRPGRH